MEKKQLKKPKKNTYQPFEFSGQICGSQKTKVYNQERYGQFYWRLFPAGKEKVKTLFAFKDAVGEKIWQDIENFAYHGRSLIFLVKKYGSTPGNYQLLQWRKI